MPGQDYDSAFYLDPSFVRSAGRVAPLIAEIFQPGSVVDFGCGKGAWLKALREAGVPEVLGLDGPWVPKAQRLVADGEFIEHDLGAQIALGRRFDLAISLEVAEHIEAARSDAFIRNLVAAAPIILFSAAIPGQGGVRHINEQWPAYWHRLFSVHGLVPVDGLRAIIWDWEDVDFWYRQNMLIYTAPDRVPGILAALRAAEARHGGAIGERPPRALVHPAHYEAVLKRIQGLERKLAKARPLKTLARAWRHRVRRYLRGSEA